MIVNHADLTPGDIIIMRSTTTHDRIDLVIGIKRKSMFSTEYVENLLIYTLLSSDGWISTSLMLWEEELYDVEVIR